MASRTRDARVIAAVSCPRCHAQRGQPCKNPEPHDRARGPDDRRAQPQRPHRERRAEWQQERGAPVLDAIRDRLAALGHGAQAEAAEAAGLTPQAVNNYLAGRRPIRLDDAERLAAAVGLEVVAAKREQQGEIKWTGFQGRTLVAKARPAKSSEST